jgi:hypothetical protein
VLAQESQVVDLNVQSKEAQAKSATDFYVGDKTEEPQKAPLLSGPALPFSGSYIALGAGLTRASQEYTGKPGGARGNIAVSHILNTLGYHIVAGFGRTLGNGPYVGMEMSINITPHADQQKIGSSGGLSVISTGLTKVALGVNARFGYVLANVPLMFFVNLGGIQTKSTCVAFSSKQSFSTFRPLVGIGTEYKLSKTIGMRGDINYAFGESETQSLSNNRSVDGKTSLTTVRVFVSFAL